MQDATLEIAAAERDLYRHHRRRSSRSCESIIHATRSRQRKSGLILSAEAQERQQSLGNACPTGQVDARIGRFLGARTVDVASTYKLCSHARAASAPSPSPPRHITPWQGEKNYLIRLAESSVRGPCSFDMRHRAESFPPVGRMGQGRDHISFVPLRGMAARTRSATPK